MMNSNNRLYLVILILIVTLMLWGPLQVRSQGAQNTSSLPSSFSYQGQLKKEGLFVNGTHDMQFELYDAESAGGQVGNTLLITGVPVTDGIFSVSLDFGATAFQGGHRWLEIAVKPSSGGEYSTLAPRQLVSPSPYVAALHERVESLEASNTALSNKVADLETLLGGVTREDVGGYDTLRFSGMNVQIVNGTGSTAGTPNGRGNLIVGYNEQRTATGAENNRTGSHYVIIGREHNYSAFGGIVAGLQNTASGNYASVSGGYLNTASGNYASVSGGRNNTASRDYASVSGGLSNTASGNYASVSGGYLNTASEVSASVSGGAFNNASGSHASILGGDSITVSTYFGIYPE